MVPACLFDSFLWPCLLKSFWRIKQRGMSWCDSISGLLIDISVPLPIVYFSTPVPKVPFSTISYSFLLFCAKSVLYNSLQYPVPGCRPGQRMTLRQRVSSWNLQPDMPIRFYLIECAGQSETSIAPVCVLFTHLGHERRGVFFGVWAFFGAHRILLNGSSVSMFVKSIPSTGWCLWCGDQSLHTLTLAAAGLFFGIPIFSKSSAHNLRFPWIEVRWKLAF